MVTSLRRAHPRFYPADVLFLPRAHDCRLDGLPAFQTFAAKSTSRLHARILKFRRLRTMDVARPVSVLSSHVARCLKDWITFWITHGYSKQMSIGLRF